MLAAGFDVRTFPGSELCINGSGGPTCLTRPLLERDRGDVATDADRPAE